MAGILPLSCGNLGKNLLINTFDLLVQDEKLDPYYFSTANSECPHFRGLFIDLDPMLETRIRKSKYNELIPLDNIISTNRGSQNNYGIGKYTLGAEMYEYIRERIRYETEQMDVLKGFELFHAIGGGTGSGLGSLMLEKIKEEYPAKLFQDILVVPNNKQSTNVLEFYNAILSFQALIDFPEICLVFDYNGIQNLSQSRVVDGIRKLHSQSSIRTICTSLIPYPRLHFQLFGLTQTNYMITKQAVLEWNNPKSWGCNSVNIKHGRCIGGLVQMQNAGEGETIEAVQFLEDKQSSYFVEWVPSNILVQATGQQNAQSGQWAVFLNNSTSIQELYKIIAENFTSSFRKKAFIHKYIEAGLDEMEFAESESNLNDLVSEYQQYQDATAEEGCELGGAQDFNNFREAVENGYFPNADQISSQGLFNEYAFDFNVKQEEIKEMIQPFVFLAETTKLKKDKKEYFFSIVLRRQKEPEIVNRQPINLVIVLDVSGSMSSSFNQQTQQSKMDIAKQVLIQIIDHHLQPEDRLSIVLFNINAENICELQKLKDINIEELKNKINKIKANNGTSMAVGYIEAKNILMNLQLEEEEQKQYVNRIIFLTDAQPNQNETNQLTQISEQLSSSNNQIFTNFIGVGIDFNQTLIEQLVKVKGTNYFVVHDKEQFDTILVESFEKIMFPLAFNFEIQFISNYFKIKQCFGVPQNSQFVEKSSSGSYILRKVATINRAVQTSKGSKGGVILYQIEPIDVNSQEPPEFVVQMAYTTLDNQQINIPKIINWQQQISQIIPEGKDLFQNPALKKVILLMRYVKCLQKVIKFQENLTQMSKQNKIIINEFKQYFQQKMNELECPELNKELEILNQLPNCQMGNQYDE